VRSGAVVEWLTTLNTVQDDDMLCVSVLGAGKARAALPVPDRHNSAITTTAATTAAGAADSVVISSSNSGSTNSGSTNSSNSADASAAAGDTGSARAGKP
jgi:hypothetical protein